MSAKKGDGVFKIRNDKIYVHGTINGKFYRKSTGKKLTPANKVWIKKQDPLKILAELLNINEKEEVNTTVATVAEEFMQFKYSMNITESRKKDIVSSLNRNILPLFGNRHFNDITAADIVYWLQDLKQKYSNSRVKFNRDQFKALFEYAQNDLRIVDYNPFLSKIVKSIELNVKASDQVYTTTEVAKILNNANGWLKVYLDLSFKYGIRPGELIALQWQDIDFEKNLLHIQRFRNSDQLIITKKDIDKIPRNKKHFRTIAISNSTKNLLKAYKEFAAHKEWLFVTVYNKPFTESRNILKYHLSPLLKEIGIENKGLYAARRSFASIVSAKDNKLENIQEVMGHTKGSNITEKHYIKDATEVLSTAELKAKAEQQELIFNTTIFN